MDQILNQSLNNRYRILARLAEGGMGAVYRASDLTLKREVAVKLMHPHFARQPNFQARFLQEAQAAARLEHPNIVQVYDFGGENDLLYIVMKLVGGANLEKLLYGMRQQGQWMPLGEVVPLVRQIGLALDYVHQKGILHRDIKPANIMIEPDSASTVPYRPILTDLGLAKLADGGVSTQDGTSMGTPAYMSPEQALGQPTDGRSDLYALGVLLFELSTGQRPFEARTLSDVMRFHTQGNIPRPSSVRAGLPRALEDVILKSLEKEPGRRFQSAGQMVKALEAALPEILAKPVSPPAPGGAASLMTQYQKSLLEPRSESVFPDTPTPAPGGQDQIQVVIPNQPSRVVPVVKSSLTIGRDADNDIQILDAKTSRHHARIDIKDGVYQVLDLKSSNGTILAGAALLPGIPETWSAEKTLKIGGAYLRLLPSAEHAPGKGSILLSNGTEVSMEKILTSPGDGLLGLYVETPEISLDPDRPGTLRLVLLNQGTLVDHFRVTLSGLPATWKNSSGVEAQLLPGAQQAATLTLQAPRSPTARSGSYKAAVRAASLTNPNQFAEAPISVTLGSFSQSKIELFPEVIQSGKKTTLTVNNQGNHPENFLVDWADRADELTFQPNHLSLTVPEGQSSAVQFQIKPKQGRVVGPQKTTSFSVRVTPGQGEVMTHSGELLSRGVFTGCFIPILLSLCLLLTAGGAGGIAMLSAQGGSLSGWFASLFPPAAPASPTQAPQARAPTQRAAEPSATPGVHPPNPLPSDTPFPQQIPSPTVTFELPPTEAPSATEAPPAPTATEAPTAAPADPAAFYNFYESLNDAKWTGSLGPVVINQGNTDTNGFVVAHPQVQLEDGNTYSNVIETFPTLMENGLIQGDYKVGSLPIQTGDTFETQVGYISGYEGGSVTFKVRFGLTNGEINQLYAQQVRYTGSLVTLSIPLDPYVGEIDSIQLLVSGTASAVDVAGAVWVNPHIQHH